MGNDEFWSSAYSKADQDSRRGRLSALRLALLFGTAVIALALIVPPMVDISTDDWTLLANDPGTDFTTTASVPRRRSYETCARVGYCGSFSIYCVFRTRSICRWRSGLR